VASRSWPRLSADGRGWPGRPLPGFWSAMAGLGQVAAYTRPATDGQQWPAEAGQGRAPVAVDGRVGEKFAR